MTTRTETKMETEQTTSNGQATDADADHVDISELLQRAIEGDEIDVVGRSNYDNVYKQFREIVATYKVFTNRKFRSTRLDTDHWRITIRSSRPPSAKIDPLPAVVVSTEIEASENLREFEKRGMIARIVKVANTGALAVVVTGRQLK